MVKKAVVVASTASATTAMTIQMAQSGIVDAAYLGETAHGDDVATLARVQIEQITDAAGLTRCWRRPAWSGRCAIDTEFVWERTYAPRLCLVQIATPSGWPSSIRSRAPRWSRSPS